MPQAEPMQYVVEALALTKLMESSLSHGVPLIDLDNAIDQMVNDEAVVTVLRSGPFYYIATYDPLWADRGPVEVSLPDFAGLGVEVKVQADEQLRVYVAHGPRQ